MKARICELAKLSGWDHQFFGHKTLRLAELSKRGYPIPLSFAIPVNYFHEYCGYNGWSEESISDADPLGDGKYPDGILNDINLLWKRLLETGKGPWVVRSSALDEDGTKFSFAGIYDSVLNISSYDLFLKAIQRCWNSYFSPYAVAYRANAGVSFYGMSLLVQEMIGGDKSGLTFTRNPLDLQDDHIIIEAHPGLNFALVDDMVAADRYRADRVNNDAVREIKTKFIKYVLDEGVSSINTVSISSEQREQSTLTEEEVFNLRDTGIALEMYYGYPCDIEWTMRGDDWFLLQVRPITCRSEEDISFDCYDGNIKENAECSLLDRYSEPVSTCYLSLLDTWQEQVYLDFYSKTIGKYVTEKPLQLYFNRVYWNLKYQRKYYDDLPFKDRGLSSLPKKRSLMRLMLNGHRSWYRRIDKYESRIAEYAAINVNQLDTSEIYRLLEELIDWFCNYIGKDHYQFLGLANVCYQLAIDKLSSLPNAKEILTEALNNDQYDNMTMRANRELMKLAEEANRRNEVKEILLADDPMSIYVRLSNKHEASDFKVKFDDFIARHGHRGISCDDLSSPHWVEQPDYVLGLLRQFIINGTAICSIDNENPSPIHWRIIADTIYPHNITYIKRKYELYKLKSLIRLTSIYMNLRENQRYYFDKSWLLLRKFMLEIGSRIAEDGLINDKEDIFHLTVSEIMELKTESSKDHNWKRRVDFRRKILNKNKSINPPYLIKGADLIRLQTARKKRSYKATGLSPGQVSGRARVVSSFRDLERVCQGDILVVSNFHPSWTPVLQIAGGMIMNFGNILSHGAIIAREFGIPVVVFNDRATDLFTDDCWIEIDGTQGRIRLAEIEVSPKNDLREVTV
ncbi:PEP/pyruvate-binding domain-containing protein [Paenibacillus sp. M1]|uniref:PEP/pyruvate-binding domain-containing protein n=1 Tax=Paenibacillus haidiansis TaxID=1574488 RepID=A0ABU7VRD4_9BACL